MYYHKNPECIGWDASKLTFATRLFNYLWFGRQDVSSTILFY